MALRGVLFFFLVLVISCAIADARVEAHLVMETDLETPRNEIKVSEAIRRNSPLCTLCVNFTAQAAEFLIANKTQTEIIETLHHACAKLPPYEEQCILLVDYYASLFFIEIAKIKPEEFCTKVNLCGDWVSVYLPMSDEACSICHNFVAEILTKLNDTDTQFEVVVMLLKQCNKLKQHYAQQCKKLVLQYVPLILVNGVKFLENNDVCCAIRVCKATQLVYNA